MLEKNLCFVNKRLKTKNNFNCLRITLDFENI